MKNRNVLVTTAALIALFGATVAALAQNSDAAPPSDRADGPDSHADSRHGMDGKFGHRGPRGTHGPLGPTMRMLDALDLSAEQRQLVQGILEAKAPALRALKADGRALRERMMAVAPEDADYYDTVAEIARRSGELAPRLVETMAQLRAEIYGVLTDEQQAEVARLRAEMAQRHTRWREQRAVPPAHTRDPASR
jgi:Spy/CpxP family protein refolding chaperone